MLRARKYECSDRFYIYKYTGEHSCGVEHANSSHRKISIKVIASLCVNMYRDGKGPNGGVVAKEMVRGTAENGYSCLSAFFYMFETLKGFAHMKKVIAVDGTHLHDRHKSIANGNVNVYNHAHHIYCMRHLSENLRVNHHCGNYLYLYYNAANTYSLEEFDNHFVEFKNKCPAVAVVLEYDIGFEKWSRAHFPGNRYDVMTTNIAESLNVMLIDEMEYPVASIFNSIAKRFGELFRERHAYILKSMGNQMVPSAEKIARKKMIEGDSLYVENVTGDDNQFTVFDVAYLLAYMHFINVVPLESEWCVPEELLNVKILPPLIDTKLGRKRRKRYKGIIENFKSKRRNKCSICKRTGHNRTTRVNNNKSYTSLIELCQLLS
ncbi:hypothetical protein KY290_005068 [Solanum tuberosum]|uniref:Mutator-like transposase n=1 Tax=Solanum tuberosum TaxID=4113 RepID=A0ABQ7WD28_SOLTU|nr:hypothetical protein KY289_005432 [Solanum tuberosum]KAH0778641.1 hypothetical protein KY290_005068 [Solanum tuberosum]